MSKELWVTLRHPAPHACGIDETLRKHASFASTLRHKWDAVDPALTVLLDGVLSERMTRIGKCVKALHELHKHTTGYDMGRAQRQQERFKQNAGVAGEPRETMVGRMLASLVPSHQWSNFNGLARLDFYDITVFKQPQIKKSDFEASIPAGTFMFGTVTPRTAAAMGRLLRQHLGPRLSLEYVSESGGKEGVVLRAAKKEERFVPPVGTGALEALRNELQLFSAAGVSRCVLLYGAPGVGKTLAARRLIDSEVVLEVAAKALDSLGAKRLADILTVTGASVVVLDDIDRAPNTVKALLERLSAGGSTATVIATCNVTTTLDPALLRPGRFDRVQEVLAPEKEWFFAIADSFAREFGVSLTDEEKTALLPLTPAEAKEVIKVAAIVDRGLLLPEIERVTKQRSLISFDGFRAKVGKAVAAEPSF